MTSTTTWKPGNFPTVSLPRTRRLPWRTCLTTRRGLPYTVFWVTARTCLFRPWYKYWTVHLPQIQQQSLSINNRRKALDIPVVDIRWCSRWWSMYRVSPFRSWWMNWSCSPWEWITAPMINRCRDSSWRWQRPGICRMAPWPRVKGIPIRRWRRRDYGPPLRTSPSLWSISSKPWKAGLRRSCQRTWPPWCSLLLWGTLPDWVFLSPKWKMRSILVMEVGTRDSPAKW